MSEERAYDMLAKFFLEGSVAPFLGAGVNLADRPPNSAWNPTEQWLPGGRELAQDLALEFNFPDATFCPLAEAQAASGDTPLHDGRRCIRPRPNLDLTRVAQYVATVAGGGELNQSDLPEILYQSDREYIAT
jgi:hypothetical protein